MLLSQDKRKEAGEALILGMAWSQVAATQEGEKEVAATHGLGGVRAITLEAPRVETGQSETCCELAQLIKSGLPDEVKDWPSVLTKYYPYRKSLLVVDGVVMYG